MIEIRSLTKCFGEKKALDNISFKINDASIFGLIGSNGAGKSTLLRIMAGVYKSTGGGVYLGGEEPFENVTVKNNVLYVSDFPYFFAQSTVKSMANFYKSCYENWSDEKFDYYLSLFPIDRNMKISKMSKGMQRQSALILGLSCSPKYLFFDEVFDGLDPVMRELLKKILIEFVASENAIVVIASHNLRELEDLCDHVGLIHEGGILCENDIDDLKLDITKIQVSFKNDGDFEIVKNSLDIIQSSTKGRIVEFTARGDRDNIIAVVENQSPLFCEVLPLTLEEIFISEMEGAGYDINKIIK